MRYSYTPRRSWAQWANERAEHRREGLQTIAVPVGFHEFRALPSGRIGVKYDSGDS